MLKTLCRPVARIGRASDSKSGCWGFESLLACHFFFMSSADIADFRVDVDFRLLPLLNGVRWDGYFEKKTHPKSLKKTQAADENGSGTGASAEQGSVQPVVKKSYTPASKPTVAKEKTVIDKSVQFLREVKVELKKVAWPSKKQTMGSTAVVLVIVAIISLFLGVVDAGLSGLIRAVLQ